MIDDQLSELPKSALREYAGDPRLDRVWQRLSSDLGRSELVSSKSRWRASLALAPAFGVAAFVIGVWVGRQTTVTPVPEPAFMAEHPRVTNPAGAWPPVAQAPQAQPSTAPSTGGRRPVAGRALSHGVDPRSLEPAARSERNYVPTAPSSGPPAWQQRADTGDFAGARAALDAAGGWDVALRSASPEQLMTLVDLARASGEREPAVRALRRLLASFPAVPEAPLAAWTLGNLLEQGGDRAGAAEAFAQYRRLSPQGDFAEDAAARQIDAALSEGKLALAAELVDQYEKDFPHARRLHELRLELRKLQGELVAPNPGGPSAAPEGRAAGDARGSESNLDPDAEPRAPDVSEP